MPARAPSLEDEIRDLYRGPLGAFTAGRQALAKRLRQGKDAREGEVKTLRKPPPSAWAVNQLFAREGKGVAALVGAGERARAAQRRVVSGGDAGALRQAIGAVRGEVERLAERGAAILAEAERAPGAAILERLRTNLEALALNPAAAPVAARGWLDEDLDPPGFEVLAGLQLAAAGGRAAPAGRGKSAPVPPAKEKEKERKPATVHRMDEHRERAARAAAERRERLERAKNELARQESETESARRESERAERTADEAERRAAEAERRAAQERERAETARRAADEARERLETAREAVARAREDLARAQRP